MYISPANNNTVVKIKNGTDEIYILPQCKQNGYSEGHIF